MRYRRLVGQYVTFVSIGEAPSVDDLLRGQRSGVTVAPRHWRPAADVCETPAALSVTVELAGVELNELDVLLFEDALVVEGERRPEGCAPDSVFHSAEIRHGPFRLEVRLPHRVDVGDIDARYERGLLQITLPKARRAYLGATDERAFGSRE